MPNFSSSSHSSRSRLMDEEEDQEHEVHQQVHSRTSSVSSLSSVSNNRGLGGRGGLVQARSYGRGQNAKYDRLLGSSFLGSNTNSTSLKRKSSKEMELGLGAKRFKVETDMETVPRRRRSSQDEGGGGCDDEGDTYGPERDPRTDIYLGKEADEDTATRRAHSPQPPVTPPSWLTSTLSTLPHSNALYNPDNRTYHLEPKPLPLRRTRTHQQLLSRPEQLQPFSHQPMSAQDYFSSLSSGGRRGSHSWGGESVSSRERDLAYTQPSLFGRLRSEVSPPVGCDNSSMSLQNHRPTFDHGSISSFYPYSSHQQQQPMSKFNASESFGLLLPPRPSFAGRDQPFHAQQQQQHALFLPLQSQHQFQTQSFNPIHRPSPRLFNAGPQQQQVSSSPILNSNLSSTFSPSQSHPPMNQHQSQRQLQHRPLLASPLPPPRPLIRRPSATVLAEQDYFLDDPALDQLQMNNEGGIPFSRPGPGSREMIDGMEEDLDAEDLRRRSYLRRSEGAFGGPAAGMMRESSVGALGSRASGMVGDPFVGGGSNFQNDDASRNDQGQQPQQTAPWPVAQQAGSQPSSFIFAPTQGPFPPRPNVPQIPLPLPQFSQQSSPAPRMTNFTQHAGGGPHRFDGLAQSGQQGGEEERQFRSAAEGPFLARHPRDLSSGPGPVVPAQRDQRASTPVFFLDGPSSSQSLARSRRSSPRPTTGSQLTPVQEEKSPNSGKESNRFEDASEGHRTPDKQQQPGKPSTPSTPLQPNALNPAAVAPSSLPPPAPRKTPQLLEADRASWTDGRDQQPIPFPLPYLPTSHRSNSSPQPPISTSASGSGAPPPPPPSNASDRSSSSFHSEVIQRQPEPFPFQFTADLRPALAPANVVSQVLSSRPRPTASPQTLSQSHTPTLLPRRLEEINSTLLGRGAGAGGGGRGLVVELPQAGVRLDEIAARSDELEVEEHEEREQGTSQTRRGQHQPQQQHQVEVARSDPLPLLSSRRTKKPKPRQQHATTSTVARKQSKSSNSNKPQPSERKAQSTSKSTTSAASLTVSVKKKYRKKRIIDQGDSDSDSDPISLESFDQPQPRPPPASHQASTSRSQPWMTPEDENGAEGDDERSRSGPTSASSDHPIQPPVGGGEEGERTGLDFEVLEDEEV